jgi:hypothetical protein
MTDAAEPAIGELMYGPVHVLRDPSGNQLGLLQADRPNSLVTAYADPTHANAVRPIQSQPIRADRS